MNPIPFSLVNGFLQAEGMAIEHADTIAKAGDFLKQNRPDLILLDNRLPDGQGLDFISTLRKQHPDVKIIVISGIDTRIPRECPRIR